MPWMKMDHAEVFVQPVATCGVCGRVTSDPMYACADGWCPYPAAPPPARSEEAETPVQASESQVTPEATSEQPPPDAAPAPGEPQPA